MSWLPGFGFISLSSEMQLLLKQQNGNNLWKQVTRIQRAQDFQNHFFRAKEGKTVIVATLCLLIWKSLATQAQRKKNPALPNVWPPGHGEDNVPRHQESQRTMAQLPETKKGRETLAELWGRRNTKTQAEPSYIFSTQKQSFWQPSVSLKLTLLYHQKQQMILGIAATMTSPSVCSPFSAMGLQQLLLSSLMKQTQPGQSHEKFGMERCNGRSRQQYSAGKETSELSLLDTLELLWDFSFPGSRWIIFFLDSVGSTILFQIFLSFFFFPLAAQNWFLYLNL